MMNFSRYGKTLTRLFVLNVYFVYWRLRGAGSKSLKYDMKCVGEC
jgi:hypothetical protein